MRSNQLSYPAKLIQKGDFPESGLITSFFEKRLSKPFFSRITLSRLKAGAKVLLFFHIRKFLGTFLIFFVKFLHISKFNSTFAAKLRECAHMRTSHALANNYCIAREILCNQNKVFYD